jgi:hypothetical protein
MADKKQIVETEVVDSIPKNNKSVKIETNQILMTNNSNISPYVFNSDRICKPNCIICQSEYRDEVEKIYDNQKGRKNYLIIEDYLKSQYDFDISRDALRNHLIKHHDGTKNNIALQEFSEEVQQWINMQGNKAASMRARIAVLEREFFNIANQSDKIDLVERRKNADSLKKITDAIILCENKLAEISEEAKPVNILFNQLTIIVNDELEHVDNLASKKLVSKILSRLKESCGDMLTD